VKTLFPPKFWWRYKVTRKTATRGRTDHFAVSVTYSFSLCCRN